METKNVGMTEQLWSYNEKSCLLYKIQLAYAQYCTYISAFF